ncbi:3608_t:CDS:2 [Scutellospora calospora]|uniref:3608_t:CDS:1 n=1 Tax=Scutellospora calospora TaxID=85575 RepID=A0ACA9L2L6_9GLOM|nr:3608_t:CDS:2 [Scutellospora calospora]
MSKETHSNSDIVDTGENMSLVVKTSEDISFEDDCIVVDSEDTDFAIDSNEDISFAFDNSKDTSFAVDNNEDIANNESVNSTINPSNSDTSADRIRNISKRTNQRTSIKPGNTMGTLATHLNSKHKKNIFLKQQMLLHFATTPYTPKEEKRVNEINRKFEDIREKMINLLEDISSKVSVTCDIWTSISNQLTQTKDLLLTLFDEFKITQCIMGLTTDNDTSMIVAGREQQVALSSLGNYEYTHYRYTAHILNITMKHGMQLKTIIIEKIRNFIKKLDIDTCWNSTFVLLQKFNRMKETLEYLVAKNKKQLEDSWLDESEWDQIDAMLELLELIYKATFLLSASSYLAISNVRLIFMGLLHHLDQYLLNYEVNEYYMAQSIMHKLNEYWGIIEKLTSTAVSVLRKRILSYRKASSNTSTTKQRKENKKTNQCLFFESLLQEENAAPVENKLEQYLALPLALEENPLK